MPTISVIVPVYKVEKYIHRCVDSILSQTFPDFELILVDDGSPDSCPVICDEYAAKDSRILVIHQENGGLSAARNAGIDWAFAHSGNQWLTFIDSDDWVHPEYLRRLLDAAMEHNVSVSICGYAETEGRDPEISPEGLTPVLWESEDFYVTHNVNATVAWGKLYRKECFREIRYPVGKIHEDEYVTYRILFPLGKVSAIPAPLYAYYHNPEGITKRPWTPQRLDAVGAYQAQQRYFKKNNHYRTYCFALDQLTDWLRFAINNAKESGDAAGARKLRKILGWQIINHSKRYPFILKNYTLYNQAFPKFMYLFWTAVGITSKIKRSLRKCQK